MKEMQAILDKLKAANPKANIRSFTYWHDGTISTIASGQWMNEPTVDELCAKVAAFDHKDAIKSKIAELEKELAQ